MTTCAVCEETMADHRTHECPVKLTDEEADVLHAMFLSEACDHYCCGMKPPECRVKSFLATWKELQSDRVAEAVPPIAEQKGGE